MVTDEEVLWIEVLVLDAVGWETRCQMRYPKHRLRPTLRQNKRRNEKASGSDRYEDEREAGEPWSSQYY